MKTKDYTTLASDALKVFDKCNKQLDFLLIKLTGGGEA